MTDGRALTSKRFQKYSMAWTRRLMVVKRARWEKPEGKEKKYT